MSGFKEKTWKKWKPSKTTYPVAVTDKKSTDSINSQRSSSLIRSRNTRGPTDNILAAERQGIVISSKEKSTSPFNTLTPTNPFQRDDMIIVQYGELKDNKIKSASSTEGSDNLWGELPSTEVAEGPRSVRDKGPKGGSKHPIGAKNSHHKPSAPPASPTNEKAPPPAAPAVPQTASGPSPSHGPPPRSGQSQHPGTSPSLDPENGTCDFPKCPARGTKQKERLCMAPECPVTLKKAVVKEAKKAMKRSCGKKRKNPLTVLRTALMNTFTGHDSSCKLTKEEKKALKRMKRAEEDDDANCNTTARPKKSKGVQCKPPMIQKNDCAPRGHEKVNKSTACDIPECPIAAQKIKIKEFMDKGQMCDIPSCPVKKPPPRKEKKVEPPKGCPAKPCTLKAKDEAFLNQLPPCIFEKLPRLKMTCEQALNAENGGQSRPPHTPPAMKNKDRPSTKEKDRGVTIVAAHVRVPQPSENPFLESTSNPQEFPTPNKLTGQRSEEKKPNVRASESHKLGNRRLSTPTFDSKTKSDEFQYGGSTLLQRANAVAMKMEDAISSSRLPQKIRFSNFSLNEKDSSKLQGAPEVNEATESCFTPREATSRKSLKMKFDESIRSRTKPNYDFDGISYHISQSRLTTSRTLLIACEDELRPMHASFTVTLGQGISLKDETAKESLPPISKSGIADLHETEINTGIEKTELEEMAEDCVVPKSYSLIGRPDPEARKSNFSSELTEKWPVVTNSMKSRPVVRVCHSSANGIPERLRDASTPTETHAIKLLDQNWIAPKNSPAPLTDPLATNPHKKSLSEKMSGSKNGAGVFHRLKEERHATVGASREIESKKPVISLYICEDIRDSRKLHNFLILDENTSESFRKDEETCDIPSMKHGAVVMSSTNPIKPIDLVQVLTAQSRKLEKPKTFCETCTQTLATSAVSPNKLNTIGIGGNSIFDDHRFQIRDDFFPSG